MSASEQTQVEPGQRKADLGVLRLRRRSPQEDDPDGGIDPGTPLAEIADEPMWPVCGARKTDFRSWNRERRSRRTKGN
jgi:rubredoxin